MGWQRVDAAPLLAPGEVHLWRRLMAGSAGAAEALLSEDERARAARFSFEDARHRFVNRRAFLRKILSLYTGRPPDAQAFSYGAMGKPGLAGQTPLCFNQSDSGDWTVVAVCLEAALGVDIEVVRPIDTATLAGEVFTENERAELGSAARPAHLRAFFNGWTRKEALIKADGRGLAFPLQEVEVSLLPDRPPRLVRLRPEHGRVEDWSLADFEVAPGVTGAVVMHSAGIRLLRLELATQAAR